MRTTTGLRWWIVGLISLGTILNYLARNSLSVLAPVLKTDMGITTEQYSYIVGAFQIGYTVMQPVCGMIVDFIGLRLGFALFAALWSLAGCLHAVVGGWLSLAGMRGLMGLTEAAAIPAGMKAVAEWFPNREKSVATGWFNFGTSLGAFLTPWVVVPLAAYFGWRAAFFFTGAIGFFWAALWYWFYRGPREHAAISAGERETILTGQTPSLDGPKRSLSDLLGTRRFWAIAAARFFAEPVWQTLGFWVPLYMAKERHFDMHQIALFVWLPFAAADLGGLFGGYVSPFFMTRFKIPLVWSRVCGVILAAVLMVGVGFTGFVDSPYTAIGLLCLAGFAHQTISVLVNTLSADLFDAQDVGTVAGFAGMSAWIAGLGFSLLVGALADSIGYAPLFALLGVFDLVGAAVLVICLRGQVGSDDQERVAFR